MSDGVSNEVIERLNQLESLIGEASQRCHNRTVIRLAKEGRRLARQEHQLMPFLSFSFHFINSADDTFTVNQGCEVAIEMIALLEDENLARKFQVDFSLEDYERTQWWSTGDGYKKLAMLTGHMHGFNSEGMHQCIADGLNVCRRTGNSDNALGFREFAVEVYRQADDLDMALHFARGSLQIQEGNDTNRKVASADDVALILTMQGQLSAATDMIQRGWQYCNEFHNPYLAQLNFLPLAREVACFAGRADILATLPKIVSFEENVTASDDAVVRVPPDDENPFFAYLRDRSAALEAACDNHFERAIELLRPWDRRFREEQWLSRWFDIRIRLIAAVRMSGRMDQARELGRPLEEAAKIARDWLTLRRLSRLLDESTPATPLGIVANVDSGPFAQGQNAHGRKLSDDSPVLISSCAVPEPNAPESSIPESPLQSFKSHVMERLQSGDFQADESMELAVQLITIAPASLLDQTEAAQLLQIARYLVGNEDHAVTFIDWAEAVLAKFSHDAMVVSMFAAFGARIHEVTESSCQTVTRQRIECLFRQSLDLDTESANNFTRAGLYFLDQENLGEAERCLARGFRLDRTSPFAALNLADVYGRTDRSRDALAVLDLALREGCDVPQIAWEAAMRANSLQQFDAMLAYLDRYEAQRPEQPWIHHYRAFALLEMNRPEDALNALQIEAKNNSIGQYHVTIQRASALGQLNRMDEYRKLLAEILETPISSVNYMATSGLQRLYDRLWNSTRGLAEEDPLRHALDDHLVVTGLASEDVFASVRFKEDNVAQARNVHFYCLRVLQPLDERWPGFRGCLAGEEDWTSYEISWGVLAEDEDRAREDVLKWQQRCFPIPAVILTAENSDDTFEDIPGVVWQGFREGKTENPDVDVEK